MLRRGRKPGTQIIYNPVDTGKYRSQWSRYQKALGLPLVPQSPNEYHCPSDRSVAGHWVVDRDPNGGGGFVPGPGACPGGVIPPLASPPAASSAMVAMYAYWDRFDIVFDPAPGLGWATMDGPRQLGFTLSMTSGGAIDDGPYRFVGGDQDDDGEVDHGLYLYYAYYDATTPFVPPDGDGAQGFGRGPWTLITNYPLNGTDPGYYAPAGTDPGQGWCTADPGGGGGGGLPGRWRCNCPDYARKHKATGRWPSESRDRDWSAGNAGSGSIAGIQQPCKHLIALKLLLGDSYPLPNPLDYREMADWKKYAGGKARDRWAKRKKAKAKRDAARRRALTPSRSQRNADERRADAARRAHYRAIKNQWASDYRRTMRELRAGWKLAKSQDEANKRGLRNNLSARQRFRYGLLDRKSGSGGEAAAARRYSEFLNSKLRI